MEKLIIYESLRKFAYSNDMICNKPIKGIVVKFMGCGVMERFSEDTKDGKLFAENGIIYIIPYSNPWSWMNKQALSYTDEIVDVIIEKYDLPKDIPLVTQGDSMGGQESLVYASLTKHRTIACLANCPVCDMVYHISEREDLPRTLYSAFYNEKGTMEEALRSVSPIHMLDRMRDINYYIFHCEEDKSVDIEKHSSALVKKMKESSFKVVYHKEPNRGHCFLTEDMLKLYNEYAINSF